MISPEIEQLIVKFLTNSATSAELDMLNNWIGAAENYRLFKEYVETHFAISITMNKPNTEKAKKQFLLNIKKEKRKDRLKILQSGVKYAAILLILFGTFFTYRYYVETIHEVPNNTKIVPREEQVTLQLGNGSVQTISKKSNIQDKKGNTIAQSDGEKLHYNKSTEKNSALVYNKLMVPYGKKFDLFLADGTHVRLNSGSSLMYPVGFVKKDQRRVYLQGEAFFNVVHEKDRPFFVGAQGMDVKVYGTEFNIKNYSEDIHTEVVLVNGSVSLLTENGKKIKKESILEPGDMGAYNKTDKSISKSKVDTSIYTSWLNGNIVFRDESFDNIIKDLERSYNVVIINNNKELAAEHFNAIIETRHESIEQVLNYFSKIYEINYQVVENKIVIN
ncbi:FecR family protein [Galbibacter pacificus]|uniref:FecR domain-containing protein n=1 Tax=Galbibacter pacificus TaxID=2996052 RepID=A0ABT6FSU4_9FLAO|nr:FecR family protein [Galbibacter pacificus]MDG3582704.1 FecR domain-containing protein [Galbibacter pacificus]MDG3586177.1 FecR domain-containing protein [Galbibacter pacificus]